MDLHELLKLLVPYLPDPPAPEEDPEEVRSVHSETGHRVYSITGAHLNSVGAVVLDLLHLC